MRESKRVLLAAAVCGTALAAAMILPTSDRLHAATPACDADNGGIKLPQGFCAVVAADAVGPARHITVAPNGDVYVALQQRGGDTAGFIALRDTDGDGKFDEKEMVTAPGGGTGIALHNDHLYLATPTSVVRWKMTKGQLKPAGEMETIVTGFTRQFQHEDKGIAFDGKGSFYVNVGAPSNACQQPDRRPGVQGQDPCPLLEQYGGIWKFDENKLDQKQTDGVRYATGLRQMPAITWHDGNLYIVMNNRDSIDQFWPEHFKAEDNENRPAEPMYRVDESGDNFGWPYCFYDYTLDKLLLNPEYGGDGKEVGRCSEFKNPIAAFPAHWAPLAVAFYTGTQFPKKYQGGAFIAFHGSWNRSPAPQEGYNVTFQPFNGRNPHGKFEVFADGFAGTAPLMQPNGAAARADGVAQAPDGSLYVTDSQKGKVWRVFYRGE
jgi:glucose/arabinose dehydrogenase